MGRPRAIITLNLYKWGDTDEPDPNLATAQDDVVANGAVRGPTTSSQSLFNLTGAIDREDASTQCEDENMTLGRQTHRTGKNWSKKLPLSTEIPVQSNPAAKTGKRTIRDALPAEKVYGTSGQLTADDLDRLDNSVPSTATLSTKAKEPRVRSRLSMADTRSLEGQLTKHQLSSAKLISTLQKGFISQSQKYNAEKAEMMSTIAKMECLLNPRQIAACQPDPSTNPGSPTIVDMANDISYDSSVSVMRTWGVSGTNGYQRQFTDKKFGTDHCNLTGPCAGGDHVGGTHSRAT